MGAGASVQSAHDDSFEDMNDLLHDRPRMRALWKRIDFNGNGKVSLAEIDKMIVDLQNDAAANPEFQGLNNKPALMRAYKYTTLKEGDGDAWVEKNEFSELLTNLFFYNKLWSVFDEIDSGDDRRIDVNEFRAGLGKLDIELTEEEAAAEFDKMDKNDGGQALFDEFCKYCRNMMIPADKDPIPPIAETDEEAEEQQKAHKEAKKAQAKKEADEAKAAMEATPPVPEEGSIQFADDDTPEIKTTKFDQLEEVIRDTCKTKKKRTALWRCLDFNGNGLVSLAEIDKMIVEKFPLLNNKPALMRAYKKTCAQGDGDDWVERKEFIKLLRNLFYFNRVWFVYDQIDSGDDRRIDLAEFKDGAGKMGISFDDDAAAEAAFKAADAGGVDGAGAGGGQILFDEFCLWVAAQKTPVD